MRVHFDAGIVKGHPAIGAHRQHGARPLAGGLTDQPTHVHEADFVEIAVSRAQLGIEEGVLAVPVGIAGKHVPLGVGSGVAGQILGDIAGIEGEGAAVPAIARTAAVHAQGKTKTVILVIGQRAV